MSFYETIKHKGGQRMVKDNRIQEIIFPQTAASNTGSANSLYSSGLINGELLRADSFSNYTGSLIIRQSGGIAAFLNGTATSGTNKFESFSLSNTTGSFVMNGILQLTISGLSSGTANVFGPVSVLYR